MAPYIDYTKLPRRELQALCKQHKIPANKTNVFMAEALDAILNNAPRQQEHFQEDEIPAPDSPEVERIVEKVKGKRAPKTALLAEPELDSLAGLLANSSLNSSVHEKMTEQAAGSEKIPEAIENMLPLAPLLVAPRARRGRPAITKKEVKAVEAPRPEAAEIDENMEFYGVSEVATEATMDEADGWPKTSPEAALEAGSVPLEANGELKVYTRTKNLAVFEVTGRMEDVISESTFVSPEVEPETEVLIAASGSSPIEEKKSRKTKKPGTRPRRNAEVEAESEIETPAPMMEDVEPEPASDEVEPEMEMLIAEPVANEDTVPSPVEEKKSRRARKIPRSRRNAEVETEVEAELPATMLKDVELESTLASAEFQPETEMLTRNTSPVEEKKSRRTKKVVLKSFRSAEVDVETVEEVLPVTVQEVNREPIFAVEFEPLRNDVAAEENIEILGTGLAPVEKKSRKPKKAGSKSRVNAEVEAEAEAELPAEMVEMTDQVVPEVASFNTSGPTEDPKDAAVYSNHFSWTVPPSVLEEDLSTSLKQNFFTISPSVPREKPKARKTKKASSRPSKNATAIMEDTYEDEPPAGEEGGDFLSSSAGVVVNMSEMEAEKENAQEPVTPVKVGASSSGDDKENEKNKLLSLSMRKLRKKCKEKGLQTRGANNTRPMKL